MSSEDEIEMTFTLRNLQAYLEANLRTIYQFVSDAGLPDFFVGHTWFSRKTNVDSWTRAGGRPFDAEAIGSHG